MRRGETERNLSIITNRNDGRRKSLVLDSDFDSPKTITHTTTVVKEQKGAIDGEIEEIEVLESFAESETAEASDEASSGDKESKTVEERKWRLSHAQVTEKITQIEKVNSKHRLRRRKGGAAKEPEPPTSDAASTKSADELFRSKFGDIQFYSKTTTIFDAEYFKKSEFFGIYILFWLGTGFLMLSNVVHSYFESEIPFYAKPIISMLRKDIVKVGLTDLAMYLTSYVPFFIQYACLHNWIQWSGSGWLIHVIYEFSHLLFWGKFAAYHRFHWIAKVFLCLHSVVFLMKMHSYGYYNGYLWNICSELEFSKEYLERLDQDDLDIPKKFEKEKIRETLINSVTFCEFELEVQSRATILVDEHETEINSKLLDNLDKEALERNVEFPTNITLFNFFEFSSYPTVVYTLNFTRTKRIRWSYVLEKVIGIFGIIFLMVLVAENMMYPIVMRAIKLREIPPNERFIEYWFVLLDMMPPFLMEYLFTFFLIWDSILNAIAELSRFADRDFYGPWWSCTDWSEYARIWNRPVHKFLLRHVYHSSLSTLNLNKGQSSLVTFVISSIIHELVMYVIFQRLRGYLLLLQMSQLPLIMLSNTKYMRDKKVLGNVICWIGFISGPSMICTAYLMF